MEQTEGPGYDRPDTNSLSQDKIIWSEHIKGFGTVT
jgi:hypothetical protein